MARRRHTVDQVIGRFPQADRELGRRKTAADVCRTLEVAASTCCRGRLDCNHRRRHSALDCQAPAAFAASCVLQDSAGTRPAGGGTIRGQTAACREVASCRICHRKINPPGFAMRNIDPGPRARSSPGHAPANRAMTFPCGDSSFTRGDHS